MKAVVLLTKNRDCKEKRNLSEAFGLYASVVHVTVVPVGKEVVMCTKKRYKSSDRSWEHSSMTGCCHGISDAWFNLQKNNMELKSMYLFILFYIINLINL